MKFKTETTERKKGDDDRGALEMVEEVTCNKPEIEKARSGSRKVNDHKPSDKVIELLQRQVVHELENELLYTHFAFYYDSEGVPVLGEYYRRRAAEERLHYEWCSKYLAFRGCKAMPCNESPKPLKEMLDKDIDMIYPFKKTVEVEYETTEMIYEIVDQVVDEGDWLTFQWLMNNCKKCGKLVAEQAEEESISELALRIAEGDGNWQTKAKTIMAAYTNDLD